MEDHPKTKKKNKKARISSRTSESPQFDLISTMPDEVLIHILSFLTTKQAVHTCVLAKRWAKLWASVPVLRVCLNEFRIGGPDGEPNTAEQWGQLVHRFERFVNGVLDNRKPTCLDSVRYSSHFEGRDHSAPTAWLDRVCLIKPRIIHLSLGNCRSLHLPDSIFSCTSLEYLKINLNVHEKNTFSPASINLPSLKSLKLCAVKLHDDFTQKLFMGCPSLKYLYLTACRLYCSSISSRVLKKLVACGCYQLKEMQISCPDLVTLDITSFFKRGISLKSMTSLTKTCIAPRWCPHHFNHEFPIVNLLDGLTNITTLCFSMHWAG